MHQMPILNIRIMKILPGMPRKAAFRRGIELNVLDTETGMAFNFRTDTPDFKWHQTTWAHRFK
jgi:hypothetical protein